MSPSLRGNKASTKNPVLGDMNFEHEFTEETYVNLGSGIKFPFYLHSHNGFDDNMNAQTVSTGHDVW
jgi:hypothetical protein